MALDLATTVFGCVARSASPAPAIAPRKTREALRIIVNLFTFETYYDDR